MAIFDTTQTASWPSVSGKGAVTPGRDVKGRIRALYADGVVPAGAAINDQFRLGMIPAGARVLRTILRHGAFGTGANARIGTAPVVNQYLDTVAVVTASTKDNVSASFAEVAGDVQPNGKPGAEQLLLLTLAGAAPTAGTTFEVVVFYVLD